MQNPNSDDKCPICTDPFEDVVALDICFHRFCSFCITQWAEYEPAKKFGFRCPLCRSSFQSLISQYDPSTNHYVKSYISTDISQGVHWSQQEEAKMLANLQASTQLNRHFHVIRQRRTEIYSMSLFPIIEFELPEELDAKKLERKVKLKLSPWLERELPILLLHHHMKPTFDSLQKQQSEVSLIRDLITWHFDDVAGFFSFAIESLQSKIGKTNDVIAEGSPNSSNTLENSNTKKNSPQEASSKFHQLLPALEPFFGLTSLVFLIDTCSFILSPWDMGTYDRNVEYEQTK